MGSVPEQSPLPSPLITLSVPMPGRDAPPWRLVAPEPFRERLDDGGGWLRASLVSRLGPLLEERKRGRQPLFLAGVHWLAAVDGGARTIRLYSPGLVDEGFLARLEAAEPGQGEAWGRHLREVSALDPARQPSDLEELTLRLGLPDLLHPESPDYQRFLAAPAADALAGALIGRMRLYQPGLLERSTDFLLTLVADNPLFHTRLLRFLAVLPNLEHDHHGTHFKALYLESLRRLEEEAHARLAAGRDPGVAPWIIRSAAAARRLARMSPAPVVAAGIRAFVERTARRFIAGETLAGASGAIRMLSRTGRDATLDHLGEMVISQLEADRYLSQVLGLIREYRHHIPTGQLNGAGMPRANVSVKVSALCHDFKPHAPEYTHELVAPRLRAILLAARETGVGINVDAEHYTHRDTVLTILERVLTETPELADYPHVGIAVQCYLRDAHHHFQQVLDMARRRNLPLPLRLVKGAYWDMETVTARAQCHPAPTFLNKEESDLHFRQLALLTLAASPHLRLCLASHNPADHAFVEAARTHHFPRSHPVEHQCLHMTWEALSRAMAAMGWTVRDYLPVGGLLEGMGYMVRRVLENASQAGILAMMRTNLESTPLAAPALGLASRRTAGRLDRDAGMIPAEPGFRNVAPLRLSRPEERQEVLAAVAGWHPPGDAGGPAPPEAGGSGEFLAVLDPSVPERVLARLPRTGAAGVAAVVERAAAAHHAGVWSGWPAARRCRVLMMAAQHLLARREELAALMVHEAGKGLAEALGDVDEGVDHLRFNAWREWQLAEGGPRPSRGVVAAIAPWNFPLAIPCGMVGAALAAGNTVVFKPASHTPLTGRRLVELLHAAGVPEEALQLVIGSGEEVGRALVEHPRVAGVVFTGSLEVGRLIAQRAGKRLVTVGERTFPVRVITELGGKNAILVTASADLDQAVQGILASAFGLAGQKCSAASRVVVDRAVAHPLLERLKEACRDLRVGGAADPSSTLTPLISPGERKRVVRLAQQGAREALQGGGEVVVDRTQEPLPGCGVGPQLLRIPPATALDPEGLACRELFGPILHLIPYATPEEAVQLCNATDYALTGGIYSQSQDEVEWLQARLECGNLYVNRGITGARVAIEPFGGFKLSGSGPKAGGNRYLEAFHLGPVAGSTGGPPLSREEGPDPTIAQPRLPRWGAAERVAAALRLARGVMAEERRGPESGEMARELGPLVAWLEREGVGFMEGLEPNLAIPGQLSGNDHSQPRRRVVVVAGSNPPGTAGVGWLVAALAAGSGIRVAAWHGAALGAWLGIREQVMAAGWPAEALPVGFPNASGWDGVMGDPLLEVVAVDGVGQGLEEMMERVARAQGTARRLIRLLTPLELPPTGDGAAWLEQFLVPRTVVVNTLRHGALLE